MASRQLRHLLLLHQLFEQFIENFVKKNPRRDLTVGMNYRLITWIVLITGKLNTRKTDMFKDTSKICLQTCQNICLQACLKIRSQMCPKIRSLTCPKIRSQMCPQTCSQTCSKIRLQTCPKIRTHTCSKVQSYSPLLYVMFHHFHTFKKYTTGSYSVSNKLYAFHYLTNSK